MAAKESQGLQAIIIVLTLLVIGLMVGLLLVNNAKKTAQARAETNESRYQEEQKAASTAQNEANTYKQWMGFSESDTLDTLRGKADAQNEDDKGKFTKDMEKYGKSFEPEARNYRDILEQTSTDYEKMAQDEANAKQQVETLKSQLVAVEAAKEAQVTEFKKQMEVAEKELASERIKFNKTSADIAKQKDDLAAQLAELRNQHDKQIAELQATIKQEESRVSKLDRANTVLKSNQRVVDPFLEPADGNITWVNQKYGKAWINLGSADGLRPQVTFSVYAPDEADAAKAVKKGSIEVVSVKEPHLSEVRITDDKATNPLLPGDKIYSQVWDRGRKIGFAYTGFIDIDGDGRSDASLLERIITSSKGVVDAAPTEYKKGSNEPLLKGEMTVNTRFLILGKLPDDARPESAHLKEAWVQMSADADDLGIETIPLDEFISLMGWQRDNRAVTLGSKAHSGDFPAQPAVQEMPRKTRKPTGVFRKRLPPVPY